MSKYWKGSSLTKEQKDKILYPYSNNNNAVIIKKDIKEAADRLFNANQDVIADLLQKETMTLCLKEGK
ncbi:MAG: hypothetical protein B6I26_04190 [Desulfobacteraceae bacterium 4572_130]|nr:MAG: hypothetical protein B6I26_04190 [Desulfobacteraceae bacterium 4572_130]